MCIVRSLSVWRNWLAGALLLAVVGAGGEARGDGKVLPPVLLAQEVAMPDQRALLAWKDGVETLVIESSFVGEGTDFAWVVPLPAKPEVEAATRGTLPSVAALMLPVVRPVVDELWLPVWFVGLVAVAAALAGWRATGWGLRVAVVAGSGAMAGSILSAILGLGLLFPVLGMVLACWLGWDAIEKSAPLRSYLIVVLVGLLLFAMTRASFGKVRGSSETATEIAELTLERRVVGDFDVTLLSGREGASVARWLADNGFALPEAARAEAERHAEAGGWFVASRVRRDFAERGKSVPAPLVFRFPSEKPIYPMRFTGAGATEPLDVELFVFGPERATAEGLEPRAWGPVDFRAPDQNAQYRRGTGQPHDARVVTHPQLRRLAEGAAVVTHLRGKLSPAEMQADLFLNWEKNARAAKGLVAYVREAAWQLGVAAGVGLSLIAMIVLGFVHGGRRPPFCWSLPLLAGGAAMACIVASRLPSVEVRKSKNGIPGYMLRQVEQAALLALWDTEPGETDEARVRSNVAAELERFLKPQGWAMSVGDGPGQVEVTKQPSGKWRVIRYDAAGQARYNAEDDVELGGGYSPPEAAGPLKE
jgi:hypothetical protein